MNRYRPHRGSLADAMAEAREFASAEEMKAHVWSSWNAKDGVVWFDPEDIVIGEILGDDDRIGWKNVRHVCVKRMGNEEFAHPQCIGWCGE